MKVFSRRALRAQRILAGYKSRVDVPTGYSKGWLARREHDSDEAVIPTPADLKLLADIYGCDYSDFFVEKEDENMRGYTAEQLDVLEREYSNETTEMEKLDVLEREHLEKERKAAMKQYIMRTPEGYHPNGFLRGEDGNLYKDPRTLDNIMDL